MSYINSFLPIKFFFPVRYLGHTECRSEFLLYLQLYLFILNKGYEIKHVRKTLKLFLQQILLMNAMARIIHKK